MRKQKTQRSTKHTHLADLLSVGLTEGATEHGEVLTENEHLQKEEGKVVNGVAGGQRRQRCKCGGKAGWTT